MAVDITGLFLWSGTVCTMDFTQPAYTIDPGDATYRPLCWIDSDGITGVTPGDTFAAPVTTDTGLTCSDSTATMIWVKVACTEYVDTWIFNIAELVSSDWLMDNEGSKLIQLRFYPVP